MDPSALLLLLLDSRAPAGGHNHSAGVESAVTTGRLRDVADLESFCRARLRATGRVAAAFASAACTLFPRDAAAWAELDAEFDARTPSEAMRSASRQLGRGLRRLVRSMLPDFDVPATHHPVVLGAAVSAAGGSAELAARAAALNSITAPASAAVRLLGLDPFAVQAMLARLAAQIDLEIDADGMGTSNQRLYDAGTTAPEVYYRRHTVLVPDVLPADGAPALDLLADFHLTTEVRLFAS